MLRITIPPVELWDEVNEEFVQFKGQTLCLEHSLVSLSKWESKWGKPLLGKGNTKRTIEETIDYVKCMTLTQNVSEDAYKYLTNANILEITKYIEAPMTATHFFDDEESGKSGREAVTAELIYYWMIAFNIPFECQKWHLNRLLTLIKVCEVKNRKPKKRSQRSIMKRNAALNAARKKQWNTKG